MNRKHGHTWRGDATKTYKCWSNMKGRCHNKEHANWKDYGARGIKVCKRWRKSFTAFLADMGEAPVGMSIERVQA